MNIVNHFLILTLLTSNVWLLLSMEQPPKKIKIVSKAPKIYQPLTLAEQSADVIIAKFSSFQSHLNKIPLDLQENHIHARLAALVKSKCNSNYMSKYKITTYAFDSDCVFTDDGQYIISTHRSKSSVEVYKLLNILNGDFKAECKLDCLGSRLLCVNPTIPKVFSVDDNNCLREFELRKEEQPSEELESTYFEELSEIPPDEKLGFTDNKKIQLHVSKYEKLTKIFAPTQQSVFTLSHIADSHGNYLKQTISTLNPHVEEKSRLLFSMRDADKIVTHVFITRGNAIIYVHKDGDFQVRDQNNKILIPLKNSSPDRTVTACALNKNKNIIAIADDLKNITIVNLDTQQTRRFKQPRISSAITFIDDNHLIAAHNEDTETNERVSLTLWNIFDGSCIAFSTQKEACYCNTLDISQDRNYLLLGMGRYDIAVQSLNSFKFADGVIPQDMKLLCATKSPRVLERLARKDSTFLDTLYFVENALK